MPDVTRSDSQRSDASLKPRVSFNRDVHVKRIVPRESARIVGALSGDGKGSHFVASPVRKQRLNKSKKELEEEAAKVLHQADRLDCVSSTNGVSPEKFYTLPHRKKNTEVNYGSLDRRIKKRGSLELNGPNKLPRTLTKSPQISERASIFDVFKKEKKQAEPKKSNLRRSFSDASTLRNKPHDSNSQPLRKRSGSVTDDITINRKEKKQLSPIIEVQPREDYFDSTNQENKENIENIHITPKSPERKKKKESVTEQLKKFIDEVDEELYKETGIRITPPEDPPKKNLKDPQPIIIDLDKAEKISNKKSKKFKDTNLGKKLKSITHKKGKPNDVNKIKNVPANNKNTATHKTAKEKPIVKTQLSTKRSLSPSPRIKEAVEAFEKPIKNSPNMIHSSQKPADKLPLTRGKAVNSMVKRLSNEYSSSSPPLTTTNILISPHGGVQHNNNQPFSYTRGLSPEKYMSNENLPSPTSPVIYAQVVCGANGTGPKKQTVHTTYNGKRPPHSDSDEGLGGEENSGISRHEKTVTHFGDNTRKYFDEVDKFEEESPIKPKFKNSGFHNGYNNYEKSVHSRLDYTGYLDSSNRGRGDGMDAKRKESLTEPHENGFTSKTLGRSDLSARRDLLESRINRRLNDHSLRTSPEYLKNSIPTNVYISETTSKLYRNGKSSPIGYTDKYISETRIDKQGKSHTIESSSKQFFDGKNKIEYESSPKTNSYHYNGFDSEPKSFDSQISDYRSSPENPHIESSQRYNLRNESIQNVHRSRNIYKSNPEIHMRAYHENNHSDSYHDSLPKHKIEGRTRYNGFDNRYIDEQERKDKLVDSGIENDFKRDYGDNFRPVRSPRRGEYCNESEDEGFASSLLIASERQHTDDNVNYRRRDDKRRDYDSDRIDDPYRNIENLEYRSKMRSGEYSSRERSIDDGSHYDPKMSRDVERSTLKRIEKKPPKPEKKSSLEKVKSLFTRDSKKKKERQKPDMVREENLRSRYTEYRGREVVEPKYKKDVNDLQTSYDYSNRRRLSTPSPSPTRVRDYKVQRNEKTAALSENSTTHGSWFKSLDRLSRKKPLKDEKDDNITSGTEEETTITKPNPTKNLRFFGDTDIESNDSVRQKLTKNRSGLLNNKNKSQSTRDLHNISEELHTSDLNLRKNSHKSMTNILESDGEMKSSRYDSKPPMSPNNLVPREINKKDRSRRKVKEVSSVESSTEGDSSQQSQRSIVYLHAATVGDIPGPGYLRSGRRAASREELASNSSSRIQPQVKTLSRSFSMLAPWRPRYPRETIDIDYTQYPKPLKNGKYEQKASRSTSSRKDNSSTLKKRAQETRNNNTNSTLNRKSKSKENLSSYHTLRRSREELSKGSNSTLYKKKERLPRENSRYNRDKEDKKISAKSLSVESLGNSSRHSRKSGDSNRDVSRSISMPRDPEKSAGWFRLSKKNKVSGSMQRL